MNTPKFQIVTVRCFSTKNCDCLRNPTLLNTKKTDIGMGRLRSEDLYGLNLWTQIIISMEHFALTSVETLELSSSAATALGFVVLSPRAGRLMLVCLPPG
jgi:hypothetical protein